MIRALGALVLLLAVAFGVQTWRVGVYKLALQQTATAKVKVERDAAKAATAASEAARASERAQADRLADIGRQYEQDRANAQAEHDRIVRDLRAGAVRLRAWWDCPAAAVPGADAGAGSRDDAAELRRASAARIVGIADECDAHVRAAQAVILDDRKP
ncbi:lysis system i-spanin subunit Rz [Lysobacter enzymogenes]|uniref:lysis system i-spanin subunit Rz n=1 Tax=Lysobacter enzymogenes TaxID=69 RepID=UPI00384C91FC